MKHDTLQHLSWLHQVNLVKVLPRLRMTIQCNLKLSPFTPCIPRKNKNNNLYPISQFSFQLDFIYFTTLFCFLPYFALFLAFFILSLPFFVVPSFCNFVLIIHSTQSNGKHYKQLHITAMGSTISVVEAETVTQNTEEHRGGFRGGPTGARPSLLLNNFCF